MNQIRNRCKWHLQIPEVLYRTMPCFSLSTKARLHTSLMALENFTVNSCRTNVNISFLGIIAFAVCDPNNKSNKLDELFPKHKCTDRQVLWYKLYTKNCVVVLDTSRPTESKASFHHHYVMLSCYFGIVQENIDNLSLICIFTVFKNLFATFQVCRLWTAVTTKTYNGYMDINDKLHLLSRSLEGWKESKSVTILATLVARRSTVAFTKLSTFIVRPNHFCLWPLSGSYWWE